ncbi:MAG TPA: DUF2207 domain-containing protein [Pseudothermotoga sp.]|uniref:DUF2207 domain-containing protein n=1 Tax=Thermotoga profunda TaxID=1508420 RepID=UPI000B213E1C|nr:DUF2207 domain-containing protein [Thermotoga profunda]
MGKFIKTTFLLFFFGLVIFGIIVSLVSSFTSSIFELPERTYSIMVLQNGSANVTETVTYRLKKPFRYVSWAIDFDRPTKISNFTFQILEGPSLLGGPFYDTKNDVSISLRLLFSKSMNEYIQVPKDGLTVKVAFSYTLENLLIEGRDFTQLFVKYIGTGTSVPTKSLKVLVSLPDKFPKPIVYHHPWGLQTKSKAIIGNNYEFEFRNIPANCFVEGRFVFPNLLGTGTQNMMKSMDLSQIRDIERSYSIKILLIVIGSISYLIFVVAIPILLYRKFGREQSIQYNSLYEREIPYNDPPEIVNAIVKKICSHPDDDAIAAAILNFVKKGDIELLENEKRDITGLRIIRLTQENQDLLEAFKIFEKDGVIDFKELKKSLRNQSNAQKFLKMMNGWRDKVYHQLSSRNYLITTGNTLAKFFGIIFGILVPVFVILGLSKASGLGYEVVSRYSMMLMGASIIIGIIVLLMKKTVFSRWTSDGLLYYLKWKNFEKFITDFSALSTYPPQSVILWDDYIVYATALGVAKEVIDNLKKLYPEPPSTPVASKVYYSPTLMAELSSFRSIATSTISSSSSGGSHSGGRVGGGSGGSRVGAG